MSRYPGARRAGDIVYTQDDLAKIEAALQRPLSEAFTQQLQQSAYDFRWLQASLTERRRLAREQKVYATLLHR
jgi:hypothetical protein